MTTPSGHYFTPPDFSSTLDCGLVALLSVFCVTSALANKINIPFFTRGGGLLTYSKFAAGFSSGPTLPSRLGMTLLYSPAMFVALLWFLPAGAAPAELLHTFPKPLSAAAAAVMNPSAASRTSLSAALMVLHFLKRTLECLFLHKYSGSMPIASSAFIGSFYCIAAATVSHYASVAPPLASAADLGAPIGKGAPTAASVGLALAYVGLAGNLYHHWLLARLRAPGAKRYKVPTGGLFEYVAAPHYLCELLGWAGVALVARHALVAGTFVAMSVYLADRAVAQTEWNRKKLDNYPRARGHLVPFLF